jgi:hypothetical protein
MRKGLNEMEQGLGKPTELPLVAFIFLLRELRDLCGKRNCSGAEC